MAGYATWEMPGGMDLHHGVDCFLNEGRWKFS